MGLEISPDGKYFSAMAEENVPTASDRVSVPSSV